MGVIEGGLSGNFAEVDGSFDALHVTERPQSPKSGGSYRVALVSGLINGNPLAADSTLFSFRWTSSTKRGIIRYIDARMFLTSTGHAAAEFGLDIIEARSFTGSDSGGTAATLTGNNLKKRVTHASTAAGDIRIASTAGLTVGTRTLDANPFAESALWELAGGAAVQHNTVVATFDDRNPGLYPLNLGQDEGFIIRNTQAHLLAVTVRLVVTLEWDEYLNADFAG